jgi:glutaredoxin
MTFSQSGDKELVVYSRTSYCPYQMKADRVFKQYGLEPRTLMIDRDEEARQRVEAWTGYRSVPTILAANPGEDLPGEPPAPLAQGASPRGVDRGSMITEASEDELTLWLRRHGFIE